MADSFDRSDDAQPRASDASCRNHISLLTLTYDSSYGQCQTCGERAQSKDLMILTENERCDHARGPGDQSDTHPQARDEMRGAFAG